MSEWACWGCGKPIKRGDNYIKDEDGRYCSDCYESQTTTDYFIGGEHIGNGDEVQEFYSWFKEGADE